MISSVLFGCRIRNEPRGMIVPKKKWGGEEDNLVLLLCIFFDFQYSHLRNKTHEDNWEISLFIIIFQYSYLFRS